MRLFCLSCLVVLCGASMSPLGGFGSNDDMFEKLRTGNVDRNPYDSLGVGELSHVSTQAMDDNMNSVVDMLLGRSQSSERNAIHDEITRQHIQTQGLRGFDDDGRAALLQEPTSIHRHHQHHARHYEPSHSHHSYHHGSHSHHYPHHHAYHHQEHHQQHQPRHQSHSHPSQVADVIEELEVAGDAPQQSEVAAPSHADPHLRDRLKHAEHHQVHPSSHSHHTAHLRGSASSREAREHVSKVDTAAQNNDDDEVPLDEFGLKKDCHWIQMDFTQNSDNCNQCMTVADAYFRGDDICVCYKNKPGAPLRTSCNDMTAKFKENEDHIRELAVENQWNEYYKSYGLCENFGHCGA